ncbi:EstA family serine hydrolase [Tupanvirus deep ocean]|uniref:EstA family serine hydrolase n=2 Tax=Tupanvirus TaxID=2094720 RepID=A0AC62A988_9VIRU|nr:EstA family serine hydrolase [Tupanvirus deep ocean]QKU34342.1 EstA family serine hydrolase [Tupanvirus deep ocean]
MKIIILITLLIGLTLGLNCRRFERNMVQLGSEYPDINGYVHNNCLNVVADTYQNLFSQGLELGSSVSMYYRGCKIIDLYGGNRTNNGDPWEYDTLTNSFSASKGLHSFAVAKLQDLSGFQYEDFVVNYWPEFAQNGKVNVTLEQLFSYKACLPAFDNTFTISDTFNKTLMDTLAAAATPFPLCNPYGFFAVYQPYTMGYYVDAMSRRLDPNERDLVSLLVDELYGIDGLDEFEIYYTPTSLNNRIAEITNETFRAGWNFFQTQFCTPTGNAEVDFINGFYCRALSSPLGINDVFSTNNPANRNLFAPSSHLWTTARSLAAFYNFIGTTNLRRSNDILSNDAYQKAIKEVYRGFDFATGTTSSYTRAGFEYPVDNVDPFSPNENAFGRTGLGYQVAFSDPDNRMGFAYLTRNLYGERNPATLAMVDAAYQCLSLIN